MAAKVKISQIVSQARILDNERMTMKRLKRQYITEFSAGKGDVVVATATPHTGRNIKVKTIQLRENRNKNNTFEVVMRGPVMLKSGKTGVRSGERVVKAVK